MQSAAFQERLCQGIAIPAHPLALTKERRLDERRQRALTRYYTAAGAGGVAVGVHTTQFEIHRPKIGLYRPVLELAAEELDRADARFQQQFVRVAGICGETQQAVGEATVARDLGYHAGLLSLGALKEASEAELAAHCRSVAGVLPLFGFYLQPAVGGRPLDISFWHRFCDIENAVAIKIAAFDRYRTIDVVRAVIETGRDDIALYTGNDDNIIVDLLTPYRYRRNGEYRERRMVGGLLGHWAVWTRTAVNHLRLCQTAATTGETAMGELLQLNVEVTDANGVLFDAAHNFAGCLPGIHEVLRRQGLLENVCCLDAELTPSDGQREQIDRVYRAYPHLNDDSFVAEHLAEWLDS